MKARALAVAAIASIALTPLPASSDHTTFPPPSGARWLRFSAPVPCSFVCAYWVDAANTDLDDDGDPEVFFDVCAAPFPPGAWDDWVVRAPSFADLLYFAIYPRGEWDAFMCGPNGENLAPGSNLIYDCDSWIEPHSAVPVGCQELIVIRVRPGDKVILRAYNWADPTDLMGWYAWVDV